MFKQILNNKIVKSGIWYTLSNFFVSGLTFLTIPIFTRLLSTSDYGVVSLYKTWLLIFMIIISLSLTESIRRAKYDYEKEYSEFASSIAFLSSILLLFFLVVVILFINILEQIMGLSKFLIFLMIFHAFFLYIKELFTTKLRYDYKYKLASVINIFPAVLGVTLSIVLIINDFVEYKYIGKIIGDSFFIILIGVAFLFYLFSKGRAFVKIEYWKYALSISVPLVIHNLSKIVNNQADIVIINHYLGESDTGIYSFAYSIGMIVTVMTVSMGQAWEPWFFQKFKENNFKLIKDRAKIYRDFFTVIYICILMVTPEIIKIMAAKEYWGGIPVVPWVFLGLYFQFMYSFEVNVEFALKKTHLISIGTIFAAIINVVLNIIFVPKFGYIAAALTTAMSFLLLFVFHYILTSKVIVRKVYGFKFYLGSICIVLFSTIYFVIFQESFTARIIGIIIAVILFYKSIMPFLNKLFNSR